MDHVDCVGGAPAGWDSQRLEGHDTAASVDRPGVDNTPDRAREAHCLPRTHDLLEESCGHASPTGPRGYDQLILVIHWERSPPLRR